MKKANKKGFTLVELLAVIVILGVLLMIAVPAVQNVIRSSRKKAFESAAKLAVENVETIASSQRVTGKIAPCYVSIAEYTTPKGTEYVKMELERGSFNDAIGYISVNEDGKGTIYMSNSDYAISGGTSSDAKAVAPSSDNKITEEKMKTTIGENVCTWYYN